MGVGGGRERARGRRPESGEEWTWSKECRRGEGMESASYERGSKVNVANRDSAQRRETNAWERMMQSHALSEREKRVRSARKNHLQARFFGHLGRRRATELRKWRREETGEGEVERRGRGRRKGKAMVVVGNKECLKLRPIPDLVLPSPKRFGGSKLTSWETWIKLGIAGFQIFEVRDFKKVKLKRRTADDGIESSSSSPRARTKRRIDQSEFEILLASALSPHPPALFALPPLVGFGKTLEHITGEPPLPSFSVLSDRRSAIRRLRPSLRMRLNSAEQHRTRQKAALRPHVLSGYIPLRRESYDMSHDNLHVSTTLSPPQNTFRRLSMPMRPALDSWSAENEVVGRGRRRQLRNGWYPVRAEVIS
ncbi:hypothetical protein B0H11DRAFT_2385952 [Mycena galericulata]|nr:hypothetical protein B0H11DRAFT_2385952 [Mycena galericulata]